MDNIIRAAQVGKQAVRLPVARPPVVAPVSPAPAPMTEARAAIGMPTPPAPPVTPDPDYERRLAEALERARGAAEQRGYDEGLKRGQASMEKQYAAELDHLRGIVRAAREALDQQFDGMVDIGGEIVFEAVCKILGHNIVDRAGAVAVVREVIRRAKDRTSLVLRVHPDDRAIVEAAAEALVGGGQAEVIADERVALGGCLLETPAGTLDGRLEVQLEALRETLLAARASHPKDGAE